MVKAATINDRHPSNTTNDRTSPKTVPTQDLVRPVRLTSVHRTTVRIRPARPASSATVHVPQYRNARRPHAPNVNCVRAVKKTSLSVARNANAPVHPVRKSSAPRARLASHQPNAHRTRMFHAPNAHRTWMVHVLNALVRKKTPAPVPATARPASRNVRRSRWSRSVHRRRWNMMRSTKHAYCFSTELDRPVVNSFISVHFPF